jgi:hypothetical protein
LLYMRQYAYIDEPWEPVTITPLPRLTRLG